MIFLDVMKNTLPALISYLCGTTKITLTSNDVKIKNQRYTKQLWAHLKLKRLLSKPNIKIWSKLFSKLFTNSATKIWCNTPLTYLTSFTSGFHGKCIYLNPPSDFQRRQDWFALVPVTFGFYGCVVHLLV